MKNKFIIGSAIFLLVFSVSTYLFAAEITQTSVEDKNDFILEPAKIDVLLNPGEKATRYLYVTSRVNKPTHFRIELEDFIGTDNPERPVELLGDEKSPYSLKDYLHPEISDFTLDFGQKIKIPVDIDLPDNAAPGGFYASVLISNAPDKEGGLDQTGAKSVSRVGALLFVRIAGEVKEEGNLEDFFIKEHKLFYQTANFTFDILFKNTGNVHLVPYGTIEIKNIWGKSIDAIPVDAYFSLPQASRYREVQYGKGGLLGFYRATLNLHRGYGDTIDTQTISFWVIPWKIIIIVFGVIFILLMGYYYIRKNFEFKKKK
jgi:hypothetical protein